MSHIILILHVVQTMSEQPTRHPKRVIMLALARLLSYKNVQKALTLCPCHINRRQKALPLGVCRIKSTKSAPARPLSYKRCQKSIPLGACRARLQFGGANMPPQGRREDAWGCGFGVPLTGTRDRPRWLTLMRVSQRTKVRPRRCLNGGTS